MDRSALFETLLDPGERILWSGQPRRLIFAVAGLNFAVLTVGLGYIFGKMQRLQTAPLPAVLELELALVAFMLVAVGWMLGMRIFRAWNTSYAVTDRRLLTALGLNRTQVRTVPLADLDTVKTEYRPKMGKVLLFHRRGGSKTFIWAVSDVEQVRKLIEAARTVLCAAAA
jgi:hypothetical protein